MTGTTNLIVRQNVKIVSRIPLAQEQALMRVGQEKGWPFYALGIAPAPKELIVSRSWRLVPIQLEKGVIPAHALERVQAIYAAGIRPKTFIIAHEITQQLPTPTPTLATQWHEKFEQLKPYAKKFAHHSATALRVTGRILVDYVFPATVTIAGIAAMLAVGMASAALVDPCLIAVTEDNVWIQIDSWLA